MTSDQILSEIIIIGALLVFNALLSLSEMALVSTRPARLQQLVKEGHASALMATKLAESPSIFLSTVQIGITLVGVLSGAFGGARLPDFLAETFEEGLGISTDFAQILGSGIVFGTISFFSVVIGELVPKRIGLRFPEKIALFVAFPMSFLTKISYPIVVVLSSSTEIILKLFGLNNRNIEPTVTHEEIQAMMTQGEQEGIFENQESAMVKRLLNLSKKRITTIMTPTHEIIWIDEKQPILGQIPKALESRHSQFPVASGDLQHLLGTLHTKDLCQNILAENKKSIHEMVTPPLLIPESLDPLEALEQFKRSGIHIGYVIDEFGAIEGILTLNDILEAIVGDIPTLGLKTSQEIVQRDDGSWLVEAWLNVDEVRDRLQIPFTNDEEERLYETLGGFVLHTLGRVPVVSDHFNAFGFSFEVVDMDRNRIDKILISKLENRTILTGA